MWMVPDALWKVVAPMLPPSEGAPTMTGAGSERDGNVAANAAAGPHARTLITAFPAVRTRSIFDGDGVSIEPHVV
jgi:transposase